MNLPHIPDLPAVSLLSAKDTFRNLVIQGRNPKIEQWLSLSFTSLFIKSFIKFYWFNLLMPLKFLYFSPPPLLFPTNICQQDYNISLSWAFLPLPTPFLLYFQHAIQNAIVLMYCPAKNPSTVFCILKIKYNALSMAKIPWMTSLLTMLPISISLLSHMKNLPFPNMPSVFSCVTFFAHTAPSTFKKNPPFSTWITYPGPLGLGLYSTSYRNLSQTSPKFTEEFLQCEPLCRKEIY